LDDAIAAFKKASALDPNDPKVDFALGLALLAKEHFAEAKTCLQRALDLLPAKDPLRPIALRHRDYCDAMLALEAKLPDVLAGKAQPKDNGERIGFPRLCIIQKRYAGAARLWSDAFATDAKLADDLNAHHRYSAACSAALAAAGQGNDAEKLSD